MKQAYRAARRVRRAFLAGAPVRARGGARTAAAQFPACRSRRRTGL